MLEFIVKYWLEVLFGLICTGGAALARHYVKLNRLEKERHEKEIIEALENKMDEQKRDMKDQMDQCYQNLLNVVKSTEDRAFQEDEHIHEEINSIKSGVLSIEGRAFKEDCRRLLDPAHIITLEEFEATQAEHIIYNKLGGNHEGDGLFQMVEKKYSHGLTNAEE